MKNKLTVIIPLYNQEKYIKQCLESILKQNFCGLSVIVVNDGSTDSSLSICESIAKKDSRVNIITQKNQGPASARYTGILSTESEYITFVDADDFIIENAYDDAEKYMNDSIDVICYEISRYYNEEAIKHEHHIIDSGVYNENQIEEKIFPKLIWDFERNVPGVECSQCVRIIKKIILQKMYKKLNDKRFYYGEDIAITYPAFAEIKTMVVIPKSYYMHRQRNNGSVPSYISCDTYFDEVYSLTNYLRMQMNSLSSYDFNKQIDYLFMYSVNLRKLHYNNYFYQREYLFPFGKIQPQNSIVLYGAGEMGMAFYAQLKKTEYCNRILWVDKNAEFIKDNRVGSIEILKELNVKDVDNVVIAIENKKIVKDVEEYLIDCGFSENVIVKG